MTKRTRCGLLALLTTLICASCRSAPPPAVVAEAAAVTVDAPTVVLVGEPLVVTVTVTAAAGVSLEGLPVTLLAQGTFGDYLASAPVAAGEARYTLAADLTEYAGTVAFTARAGGVEGQAQTRIEPGPPADPIVTLVGPRSLQAAREATMLTAVVRDRFGNPVADDTPVTVRYQTPAGDSFSLVETQTISTSHLLAWTRIPAGEQAGRLRLSATSGTAHSAERDVLVVPGPPVDFAVRITPAVLPADGRQLAEVQTTELVDEFGNVLLDGTTVTFLVEQTGALVRSLPAQVIDGRAATVLQAPTAPGALWVRAVVADVSSPATMALFTPGPAIQPFAIAVQVNAETVDLTAGPLLGNLGQFAPDATQVRFRTTDADGRVIEEAAPTERGYARLTLRLADFATGPVQVEATAGIAAGAAEFEAP